jgi:hypothetical protein
MKLIMQLSSSSTQFSPELPNETDVITIIKNRDLPYPRQNRKIELSQLQTRHKEPDYKHSGTFGGNRLHGRRGFVVHLTEQTLRQVNSASTSSPHSQRHESKQLLSSQGSQQAKVEYN